MTTSTTADQSHLPLAPYKTASASELNARIQAVREQMGNRLLILGHHYQQDEVIEHSDLRGDSYQLSRMAADSETCEAIVFCGVHFMAETADILGQSSRKVKGTRWTPCHRRASRLGGRLFDGRYGCDQSSRSGLGGYERSDRYQPRHSGHLHQQCRKLKGVLRSTWRNRLHQQQCTSGAWNGRLSAAIAFSSSLINISGATRRSR
jgi:hypothetical protein